MARQFSIIDFLLKKGFHPEHSKGNDFWFLSPLRTESRASFKVNDAINRFFDHGIGEGGNIIDLVIKMFKCTPFESLGILQNIMSFSFQKPKLEFKNKKNHIVIRNEKSLTHPALISYLKSRYISIEIAQLICKEIEYEFSGKQYFSIGLKNESGGWELRNKIFKNSSSPKDFLLIKNQSSELIIVEGMFDLLTVLSLFPGFIKTKNLLVLNSISFAKKAEYLISEFELVGLYLDRDESGINVTNQYLKQNKNCVDMSNLYKGFKDVNEYLVSVSKKNGFGKNK